MWEHPPPNMPKLEKLGYSLEEIFFLILLYDDEYYVTALLQTTKIYDVVSLLAAFHNFTLVILWKKYCL